MFIKNISSVFRVPKIYKDFMSQKMGTVTEKYPDKKKSASQISNRDLWSQTDIDP